MVPLATKQTKTNKRSVSGLSWKLNLFEPFIVYAYFTVAFGGERFYERKIQSLTLRAVSLAG